MPAYEVLAVFGDGLALCRDQNDVVLVDVARTLLQIWSSTTLVVSKPLMFPQSFSISPATERFVDSHAELLISCGLDIELVGPGTVMLREVPEELGSFDIKSFRNALEGIAARAPSGQIELLSLLAKAVWREMPQYPLQRAAAVVRAIADRVNIQQLESQGIARRLDAASLRELLPPRG
ncbi:MAG: hypothetical protein U1F34_08630 [Gammaproteobacteria bacterium]